MLVPQDLVAQVLLTVQQSYWIVAGLQQLAIVTHLTNFIYANFSFPIFRFKKSVNRIDRCGEVGVFGLKNWSANENYFTFLISVGWLSTSWFLRLLSSI